MVSSREAGEDRRGGGAITRSLQGFELAALSLQVFGREAIWEEDPLQVVEFVLEDARRPAVDCAAHRLAVHVLRLDLYELRPLHTLLALCPVTAGL